LRRSNDFASAPFGIAGLETAVPALFDRFISPGLFGWDLLAKRYSAEPRRLLKLKPVPIVEGGVAEFIVFNPEADQHLHARLHEVEEHQHALLPIRR